MSERLDQHSYQLQIQVDLWLLDACLTGRDPRAGRGDEHRLVDLEEFVLMGRLYYLSDGGYSRVYYPNEEGPVCLASESTDDVKRRWTDHDVQHIAARLTATCRAYYQTLLDAEANPA